MSDLQKTLRKELARSRILDEVPPSVWRTIASRTRAITSSLTLLPITPLEIGSPPP